MTEAKRPFVTKERIEELVKKYPTPFHLTTSAASARTRAG